MREVGIDAIGNTKEELHISSKNFHSCDTEEGNMVKKGMGPDNSYGPENGMALLKIKLSKKNISISTFGSRVYRDGIHKHDFKVRTLRVRRRKRSRN